MFSSLSFIFQAIEVLENLAEKKNKGQDNTKVKDGTDLNIG
jgi:hypothetical protein